MKSPFVIFPAIDLLNGQSVRLKKGKRETAEVVAADPLEQLERYESAGATWVHVVDLNAAFGDAPESAGCLTNKKVIREIIQNSSLKIQLGGGIRDVESAESLLKVGVQRLVLGTWVTKNPEACINLAVRYPNNIVVGLDALGDKIAVHGWTEKSEFTVLEFGKRLHQAGVTYALYTEIERDGTLSGIDAHKAGQVHSSTGLSIIASGGARDLRDIEALSQTPGVHGVVIGKALKAGTLSLKEALLFQRT
jgi:phosphoribosylformimino-5-aminoimidazole carboxamide ribotide isomerase